MYKIVILEDEQIHMERIVEFLRQYETDHQNCAFSIEQYSSGLVLLDAYRCDADVLFLDIYVSDMLGMDVAQRIRMVDQDVTIIFVTNLSEYAVESYSVQAFDYILKPFAYPAFQAKLDRLLRWLDAQKSKVALNLKTKESIMRVYADDILYLEVLDHDVYVHTGYGKSIRQWGSLSKFEAALQGAHFARCNSCYLVNLKYVQKIQGDRAIVAGHELAISKPKRKEFLNAFAQYMGGSW